MVQGGASLFSEDLRRNGVKDSQAIYNLIYSGKGKMPGYGLDCAPRVRYTRHLYFVISVSLQAFKCFVPVTFCFMLSIAVEREKTENLVERLPNHAGKV